MSKSFEDLEVWERSKALAVGVCKSVSSSKNFALRDQMMRSAISVPSNIAEGAERNSSKEFVCFIAYAKGSLAELRTQLMIASELDEIEKSEVDEFLSEAVVISKMLYRLGQSQKT